MDIKNKEHKYIRPSCSEETVRKALVSKFKNTPIPDDQILENLELFMRPQRIAEILSLREIYMKILDVQGIIIEFGVRWGRHLSVFSALRSIYEPYNFYRRIIGFDTFTGFPRADKIDGESDRIYEGSMSVSTDYENYLNDILDLHEAESPLSHLKRTELYKGNAPVQLKQYLDNNPASIIALAYFDMDLYRPTKECLEIILPFLSKGSILAFDELCHPEFQGETIAVKEALDINKYEIKRFAMVPSPCYIVL